MRAALFDNEIEGASAHGLAFVVQHDCNTTLGQPGAGMGFAGIRNSMAVVLTLPRTDDSGKRIDGEISVHCAGRDKCNAHGGGAKICSAPIPILDSEKSSQLDVRYVLEGGEAIGQRPKMVLRVSLDGADILGIPLDLTEMLALERGSGRAWVGVVAGGSIRRRASSATPSTPSPRATARA